MSKRWRIKSYSHKILSRYQTVLMRKIALEGLDDMIVFNQELKECAKYLHMVDTAVGELRESKRKSDKKRYWVLYFTFLSQRRPASVTEIIENISDKLGVKNMPSRTYYRLKAQGIEAIGRILDRRNEVV